MRHFPPVVEMPLATDSALDVTALPRPFAPVPPHLNPLPRRGEEIGPLTLILSLRRGEEIGRLILILSLRRGEEIGRLALILSHGVV